MCRKKPNSAALWKKLRTLEDEGQLHGLLQATLGPTTIAWGPCGSVPRSVVPGATRRKDRPVLTGPIQL